MFTKTYKVPGFENHRQRVSFGPSFRDNFSRDGITRIIEVFNSDKTGTNAYSIVRITRDTEEDCISEMFDQLDDGIFENSRIGRVKIVDNETFEEISDAEF